MAALRARSGRSPLLSPSLLFAFVAACASGPAARPLPPPPPAPAPEPSPPTPCEVAAAQRARVPGLLAKGRLDRTVRVLDRADALCPASAPASWAARVGALADLGRREEAQKLADEIDASAGAPAEARAAAKAAREAMAAQGPAVAEALVQAGIEAEEKGDGAQGQRLFDRAAVAVARETGKTLAPAPPPGSSGGSVPFAWSRDGGVIAVAAGRGVSLRERRVAFRETLELAGPEDNREADVVVFSPDGKIVAASSGDSTVHLWDVATGAEIRRLGHPTNTYGQLAQAMAFSSDGGTLASALGDGSLALSIRLWDVATGSERTLPDTWGNGGGTLTLAFSRDGKTIAIEPGSLREARWDVRTGRHVPRGPAPVASQRTLSPDGKTAAEVGGAAVRLVDVATGAELRKLAAGGVSDALTFSPDGAALAGRPFNHQPTQVWLWDVATGALRGVLDVSPYGEYGFSPDGRTLTADGPHGVSLLDVATGRVTPTWRPLADEALVGVAPSLDGATFTSVSRAAGQEVVRSWTFATRAETRRLGGRARSVELARDGAVLALGSGDATRLWRVATAAEMARIEGAGGPVAFSPQGKTLALTSDGIQLWTRGGGLQLEVRALTGHDAGYALLPSAAPLVELIGPDLAAASAAFVCLAGARSFPFGVCRERFEVPGLVAKVLAGDASYADP